MRIIQIGDMIVTEDNMLLTVVKHGYVYCLMSNKDQKIYGDIYTSMEELISSVKIKTVIKKENMDRKKNLISDLMCLYACLIDDL